MNTGTRAGVEPRCPFCNAPLARPAELSISTIERVQGGTCGACGAIYVLDPTGKNVGEIMMQGLNMVAAQLAADSTAVVLGEDYEDAVLSYDWRTHRSTGVPQGYMDGHGRLYVVRAKKGDTPRGPAFS